MRSEANLELVTLLCDNLVTSVCNRGGSEASSSAFFDTFTSYSDHVPCVCVFVCVLAHKSRPSIIYR